MRKLQKTRENKKSARGNKSKRLKTREKSQKQDTARENETQRENKRENKNEKNTGKTRKMESERELTARQIMQIKHEKRTAKRPKKFSIAHNRLQDGPSSSICNEESERKQEKTNNK